MSLPGRPSRGALAALAAFLASAGLASTPLAAQQRIERGLAASPDATIRIYNLSGSTTITGWERDSVAIVADLAPGAGRFYMAGHDAIKLGVEPANPAATPGSARLEIRVPRGGVVWVKAADASIEVDGVEGGLDLYSVSGSVRVRGAPATVRAESMEGSISIDARTPWLRAKTASGSIDLAGAVSDLAAASVSGTIRVAAARQARARIESVTGEIVVSGRPTRGGAWEIETHSGPVTLALASDTDAEIEVHTFGGEVRADLGRVVNRRIDDLAGSDWSILVGAGGTSMTVRTFKAPVTVRPAR
ncbi:MAG TPA: DUF4097 family beta strand repeat-containing protein [Gemmatimonadota bacterium]|nr:DUF4097 family beta strand repeat-containing protein [Gemmatimonadota bacterium]